MGNFNSRKQYNELEGGLFVGAFSISILVCVSIAECLKCCIKRSRKNRLWVAGAHLLRAGEAFVDAAELLRRVKADARCKDDVATGDDAGASQPESQKSKQTGKNDRTDWEAEVISLSGQGTELEKIGYGLQSGNDVRPNFQEFLQDSEIKKLLKDNADVMELLDIAKSSLESARDKLKTAVESEKGIKTYIIEALGGTTTESWCSWCKNVCRTKECSYCCTKECIIEIPITFLSLYRLVFRHSIEEVHLDGPGPTKRRTYLFGGYRNPKCPCMLHVYFLVMLLVVFNWFCLILIDTAIYRKTTTCNDLNVKDDAYLCFDVRKSTS